MALELDGRRKNSTVFLDCNTDYVYTCNKKGPTTYLNCWTAGCKARASLRITEDGGFGDIVPSKNKGAHSHGPETGFKEVLELRSAMIRRAKEEPHMSLRRIFDQECNK